MLHVRCNEHIRRPRKGRCLEPIKNTKGAPAFVDTYKPLAQPSARSGAGTPRPESNGPSGSAVPDPQFRIEIMPATRAQTTEWNMYA